MGTQRACPRFVVRALLVLLTIARVASAENGFVWEAPASCPNGEDMRARIERRLGSPLEIHGVEVAITRSGTAFVAHVDTRGVTMANQIRTLTSARCDELADAVAVIVARLASEQRQRAPIAVAVVDEEDPRPSKIEVAIPAPRQHRMWGFAVRATALSGIGMVPRVGVGGELSMFVRREKAFAEVGFARWASSSAYLVEGAPGRVEVGLDLVTVRAGWSPPNMPLRAWLGGEIGSIRGQGAALVDPKRGSAPWYAVTAGLGVGWPMTDNARLVGTFEVAVPTSRARFSLAQSGDIYSSSAMAARCALGLEVGLP